MGDAAPPGTATGRLADLVVVETSVGLAAPLVTRILAELGATAVKVESPARPDFARTRLRPPGMTDEEFADQPVHDMGAGKHNVAIDLKHATGMARFLELIDTADVYIENFAPGWLERLGLSLADLSRRNPRLVILSQSAYGSAGPRRAQRAYAPIMSSAAGLDSVVGYPDGRIATQTAMAASDLIASYYGITLVLAALHERQTTGLGTIIDQSQIESTAALMGVAFAEFGLTGRVPPPPGNRLPGVVPHGIFPSAGDDDWVAVAAYTDDDWAALSDALAIAPADAARFARVRDRVAGIDDVEALVRERTALEPRDELVTRLQGLGIACTPVLRSDEIDDTAAFGGGSLWDELPRAGGGVARVTRIPWRFDEIALRPSHTAEAPGASTRRVATELLGADDDTVDGWIATGGLS